MTKKVTIQEIAAEMNLSRNTVAKALMNSDTVAYATRAEIVRKASEMGYQKMSPSVLEEFKLSKFSNESRTVIIMARRELSVFWNSIIVGISDELNRNNCRMRLNFISAEDEANMVLPKDFDDAVDAVILTSIFEASYTKMILSRELPTIFLDSPIGRFALQHNCDSIVTEGRESVAAITESLICQGMKKIGFIGDITYCESFFQRYAGFCSAMQAAELRIDWDIVFSSSLPQNYSNAELEEILDKFPYVPDAIVCANDDIALKCLRAYIKRGVNCPQDIAITGFDNEERLTQAESKLTTVSVHNQMLGQRVVQQLMWRMQHPEFPKETISIATKPIYRKSSQRFVQ